MGHDGWFRKLLFLKGADGGLLLVFVGRRKGSKGRKGRKGRKEEREDGGRGGPRRVARVGRKTSPVRDVILVEGKRRAYSGVP